MREDQIRYISSLIVDYRDRVTDIVLDVPHPEGGAPISKHQIRKVVYNRFLERLESALARRSSELTYDEEESVRIVFWGPYHRLLGNQLWPTKLYIDTFNRAESIEWLNVSNASGQ